MVDDMNGGEARAAAWELAAFSFRYPTEELAEAVTSGEWIDAAREVAEALGLELPESFGAGDAESVQDMKALRVEATRLFVGSPQPAVSPYEGVWRAQEEGVQALLFVNPHSMAVERFMKSCGLARPEGTNEPLDHIATECELLEHLALRSLKLSVLLYERVKSPLLNPLLVTVAFIIAALVALHIPLESYEQSVQLISFLLGPATVALAYSVYRQRQTLKDHFVPIFAGCLVGSVVSMTSAYALCKLLGLDDTLALSFIPKSVTTPIAIAVSQQLGGITSITVAAVIVTGILGAITAPLMARLFRVRDGIAKGVAIGTCSHAVGTTKALEMGELEGAMSGVSIAVSGLLTTAIVIVASCFL